MMMAVTLKTKRGTEVLAAIQDMHARLEARGYKVLRVHSDRGSEFLTTAFKRCCSAKRIRRTTTTGDDPKGNGRAEAAIGIYNKRPDTLAFGGFAAGGLASRSEVGSRASMGQVCGG